MPGRGTLHPSCFFGGPWLPSAHCSNDSYTVWSPVLSMQCKGCILANHTELLGLSNSYVQNMHGQSIHLGA